MDDAVNNPTLLTTTGKPEVTLKLPNGASQKFANMQELANFSDSLRGMVEGWRGSEEQKKLEGARKAIYEVVVEGMRRQIAEVNPEAAKGFPDQVLVGAGFIVDAVEVDGGFRVAVEMHVRSIILLVANILASVRPISAAPKSKQPQVDVRELVKKLDEPCPDCDDTGMMELFGEIPAPQFTNCHCLKGRRKD